MLGYKIEVVGKSGRSRRTVKVILSIDIFAKVLTVNGNVHEDEYDDEPLPCSVGVLEDSRTHGKNIEVSKVDAGHMLQLGSNTICNRASGCQPDEIVILELNSDIPALGSGRFVQNLFLVGFLSRFSLALGFNPRREHRIFVNILQFRNARSGIYS